jgi:hypothetical protein
VVQRREKKKERGPLDYQTPQASTAKANRQLQAVLQHRGAA